MRGRPPTQKTRHGLVTVEEHKRHASGASRGADRLIKFIRIAGDRPHENPIAQPSDRRVGPGGVRAFGRPEIEEQQSPAGLGESMNAPVEPQQGKIGDRSAARGYGTHCGRYPPTTSLRAWPCSSPDRKSTRLNSSN